MTSITSITLYNFNNFIQLPDIYFFYSRKSPSVSRFVKYNFCEIVKNCRLAPIKFQNSTSEKFFLSFKESEDF